MKQISFKVRKDEHKTIVQIADRAVALAASYDVDYSTTEAMMGLDGSTR